VGEGGILWNSLFISLLAGNIGERLVRYGLPPQPASPGSRHLPHNFARKPAVAGRVKTHTSGKCRKYNSSTRHQTECSQHHPFSWCAISRKYFYARGGRLSFHTACVGELMACADSLRDTDWILFAPSGSKISASHPRCGHFLKKWIRLHCVTGHGFKVALTFEPIRPAHS